MSFAAQVLHVFRKDVRRFWPALVGVGALLVVHRTVGLPVPGRYVAPFNGPPPIFPIAFSLLTVVVVQAHRVAGDRDFWVTRPLSPLAILAAKAGFVGLFFCAIPVAVHVQWLVALSDGGPVWEMAASSLLYQGGLLAIVAAGAAVTPSLSAFLALALSVWVGTELLQSVAGGDPFRPFDRRGIEVTTEYLRRWGWLLTGAGVLAHQYVARHTWRSAVIGLVGLGLLVSALRWSTINLAPPLIERSERFSYPHADSISFRVSSISHGTSGRLDGSVEAQVQAFLSAEGPGVVLVPQSARSRLTGRDVEHVHVVDGQERVFPVSFINPRMEIEGIRPAGRYGAGPLQPNPFSVVLARGTPQEIEALRPAKRLETTVHLDVFSRSVIARLPLERGASASIDGRTVTLWRVTRSTGGITVEVAVREAAGALTDEMSAQRWSAEGMYLHNPAREEYILFNGGGGGSGSRLESIAPVHYVVGGSRLLEVRSSRSANLRSAAGSVAELPDDWLDDASLLVTELTYEGSFERTLSRDIDAMPEAERQVPVDSQPGLGGGL